MIEIGTNHNSLNASNSYIVFPDLQASITAFDFTQIYQKNISPYLVFPFSIFTDFDTQIMKNLIRVKYLQQRENSAVSVKILPPEASLSTLNLSQFFGLLIKVSSGFFSKCINGHSLLMKTSSWTNQMYPSLILHNSTKSHIEMESSSKISKKHHVKGEIEL